tara:strand:+ start:595 stop:1191 length:597 start_codon:yes stop_codon:yes gene_type:complete
MNSQSMNLFGFPIIKFTVSDWQNKKSKLLKLIDFSDTDTNFDGQPFSIIECETDYYKYQTSAPYLNQFVDILKTDLDKLVEEYTEILTDRYRGDCPVESVDKWQLWSQRYTKGQYHGAHNHGLMNISCVLYVEFDDKLHFPTTFYSPHPNPYYGTIDKIAPPVFEGDIITFPSVLLHESPVSQTETPRTIMSFNIPMR